MTYTYMSFGWVYKYLRAINPQSQRFGIRKSFFFAQLRHFSDFQLLFLLSSVISQLQEKYWPNDRDRIILSRSQRSTLTFLFYRDVKCYLCLTTTLFQRFILFILFQQLIYCLVVFFQLHYFFKKKQLQLSKKLGGKDIKLITRINFFSYAFIFN